MFVCNDCKRSYRNLREFKQHQCLDGSLCCDYLQNPSLYMEYGGQDDGYDYSKTAICILSMLVEKIILLLTKQIYQLSNLMKIIVK
jgi:hypothetical protein